MTNDPAADVAAARQALTRARARLDEAVAVTCEPDGGEILASPELLALLLLVVNAKNDLDRVVLSASGVVLRAPAPPDSPG